MPVFRRFMTRASARMVLCYGPFEAGANRLAWNSRNGFHVFFVNVGHYTLQFSVVFRRLIPVYKYV